MDNVRGPGPVPDRWLNCPRRATKLVANKFLAFKTPLSQAFDSEVRLDYRFSPSMLFNSAKANKWRIGLWIDLTNTTRFYNKDEVINAYSPDKKVAYAKIQCRGHGEAPSEEQTQEFVNLCKTFIMQHPLEIIGVHCTHGFNRTGFLIVSYMVQVMDFGVDVALQEFARCRPPGIYKGDYIRELYSRYDDVDAAPPPPIRPVWCDESVQLAEDEDNDDDESTTTSEGKRKLKNQGNKKRKLRNVANPIFMEGISRVTAVVDKQKRNEMRQIVARMCEFNAEGFAGAQPVSMTLENMKKLKQKPYRVSWKADGTRYMMLIVGERQVYFLDRDNSVFEVSGMTFVRKDDRTAHLVNTLLDGEMVIDNYKGTKTPRYLVYDIIFLNGDDVKKRKFYPDRLALIEGDVIGPRNRAIQEGKIDKLSEPFSVRGKPFLPIEKSAGYLSEKFTQQLTHEPDGLIFQPCDDPYCPGPCENVLKWKPPSHNSIDFRLEVQVESGPGILPKKVGHLFVGGHSLPVAELKPLKKHLTMYDKKIVECRYENGKWIFMRERTDKSYPNKLKTAKAVMESIKNPVTKECLLNYIAELHNQVASKSTIDRHLMPPPQHRR